MWVFVSCLVVLWALSPRFVLAVQGLVWVGVLMLGPVVNTFCHCLFWVLSGSVRSCLAVLHCRGLCALLRLVQGF